MLNNPGNDVGLLGTHAFKRCKTDSRVNCLYVQAEAITSLCKTSAKNVLCFGSVNTFVTMQISRAPLLGIHALLHNWDPCSTDRALGPTR
ncbi:hypothetical protein Y032_0913g3018 [Ancylostoma ceylanicum]|uniref:Uncharacterized protein n=1 Tax=Ancylostoma ceylanicum TaxID=53326 RepID=A0A016W9G2_9BILA|nr:hypothetical protein Y032_0913g3018 [Ancylostoma ceylanicum]